MKLTRRKLALVLTSAAGAAAQTGAAPRDEMQTARDRLKAAAEALAAHDIPMATEPAFQFKV
jgi:hypothetical protein